MGRNSQELLGQVKQIESRLVQRIEDVEKNPILQQDQGKGTLVVRLNKIYLLSPKSWNWSQHSRSSYDKS